MLKVEQYEFIRTAHRVYGRSISEISKATGHSRNTVRKALNQEHSGYTKRSTQPYPALESYTDIIDSWLADDKERHSKQRHTARRIYHRLVKEHGFQGAESSVRRYVRQARARLGISGKKAFIPGLPDAGLEAEVDWGEFSAIIAGKRYKLKLFCMRSKYSGKCFVRAYPMERQQALFDAHIRAFQFFNGVFRRLIYDNLTTALQKVLKGKKRIEQDNFSKFRAYYTFEALFCNPREAHEKGGVEGLIGFARRNFLVPVPEVNSLQELNQFLLEECISYGWHIISGREQSVEELFQQEKDHLLSLPQIPYANELIVPGKVNHYSIVTVDKNRYSVPTQHVGFKVQVLVSVNKVKIFHDGKKIAVHERSFGNSKWVLDPHHYLDLLYQRPAAFATARPIKQWRAEWPKNHERLLSRLTSAQGVNKGTKDFVQVLMFYREYNPETVTKAIELALESGVSSSQAVRHLLQPPETETAPGRLKSWPTFSQADISVYSSLGGVQ